MKKQGILWTSHNNYSANFATFYQTIPFSLLNVRFVSTVVIIVSYSQPEQTLNYISAKYVGKA